MLQVPATRTEIDSLIKIIDPQGSGSVNILQFDKIISDYRRKLQQASVDADDDDLTAKSAQELTFSPSRVTVKCSRCGIGIAGPPREKHARYYNQSLSYSIESGGSNSTILWFKA